MKDDKYIGSIGIRARMSFGLVMDLSISGNDPSSGRSI